MLLRTFFKSNSVTESKHSNRHPSKQLTDFILYALNSIDINFPLIFYQTTVQTTIKFEFKTIPHIIITQILTFFNVSVISIVTVPFFNPSILETIIVRLAINAVRAPCDVTLYVISVTYIRKDVFT